MPLTSRDGLNSKYKELVSETAQLFRFERPILRAFE